MPTFLTPEWVGAAEPLLGELDGQVQIVVGGGPDGDVRIGGGSDPELVLTTTVDDARALLHGTLDPSVAFMQGRLKTKGDTGLLFRLLPAARTPEFAARRAQLESLTD